MIFAIENGKNLKNALVNGFNRGLIIRSGNRTIFTKNFIIMEGKLGKFKDQINYIKQDEVFFFLENRKGIIYDYYDQEFCDDIKRLNNIEFKPAMFEGSHRYLMSNNLCYAKNDDFTTKLMIEYMRKKDPEIDETLKAIEKVKLLIKEYPDNLSYSLDLDTMKYIKRFKEQ